MVRTFKDLRKNRNAAIRAAKSSTGRLRHEVREYLVAQGGADTEEAAVEWLRVFLNKVLDSDIPKAKFKDDLQNNHSKVVFYNCISKEAREDFWEAVERLYE